MFWRLFWSLVYKKHKIFRYIIYEQENNVNVVGCANLYNCRL